MGLSNVLLISVLISAMDNATPILAKLGIASGGIFGSLALAAAGVAVAIGGIALVSIKAATAFDQAMHRVSAITDATTVHIKGVLDTAGARMDWYQKQILSLAPQIDVDPTKLAQGLYFVISAGFHGAEAMNVLKYSAMAAAATMSDFSGVADAVTSLMNAYKAKALDAGTATDVLTKMVVMGKMEFKNVVASLGIIGITSEVAGIKVQEMAAAMATLSQVSGSHAIRRIGMEFMNLERRIGIQVEDVAKSAKKMGLNFNEGAFAIMPLIQKLQYLGQITGGVGYLNMAAAKSWDAMSPAQQKSKQGMEMLGLATAHANKEFMTLVGGAAAFIPAAILLSDKGKEFSYILGQMTTHGTATAAAFNNMRESTGQKWNMFKVTLESLAITLGLQLLPAVNAILMPLIAMGRGIIAFLQTTSGLNALKSALIGIAVVVTAILGVAVAGLATGPGAVFIALFIAIVAAGTLLGPVIERVAGRIRDFVGFLQSHQDAMMAFKALLIGIGVAVLASLVPAIVASVVAFGAEAIAAAGAAVAVIAATWPFILAAAAIALVVFGIMELVSHWPQVQAFFGNVAAAIGSFLGGVGSWLGNFFGQIGSTFGAFFNRIGTFVHNGMEGIKSNFLAPFRFIGALFSWLYNHNYYFSMLVDNIHQRLMTLRTRITDAINWIKNFFAMEWLGIQIMAAAAWLAIQNTIINPVVAVWNKIQSVFNGIRAFLMNILKQIWIDFQTGWGIIVGFVGGLAGRILGAVKTGVVNPIQKAIQNLVSGAFNWGKNMIQQFINGMGSMLGAVGKTAQNLVGAVSHFLGFHSPPPGVPESANWGPNLVKMFSMGMLSQSPAAAKAAQSIASGVAAALSGLAVSAGQVGAAATGNLAAALASGGGNTTNVTNNLHFPGVSTSDEVMKVVKQMQQKDYRAAKRTGYPGGVLGRIGIN